MKSSRTIKYVRKMHIPSFTQRRRPNLAALHAQNVFLRPFDADLAQEGFVRLCQKHIMVDDLDQVLSTTHLADEHTTVFMVGERHAPHSPHTQCRSILEMFRRLVAENKAQPNPLLIDFVIELFEGEIPLILKRKTTQADAQINRVRRFFTSCVLTRDCEVRVHWADPTQTKNKMPEWLYALNRIAKPQEPWPPSVTEVLRSEADLPLLLTENQTVMKEIRRASEVNPKFTVQFALTLFARIWQNMPREGHWQFKVWFLKRAAMDFYTVARIVRQKMKHVVLYCGDLHAPNIRYILQCLDFKLVALQNKKALPCAQRF